MTTIAIFTTLDDALNYSNDCHEYLKANRPKYNAEAWDCPSKNPDKNEWGIEVPLEDTAIPCKGIKVDSKDPKAIDTYVGTVAKPAVKMPLADTKVAIEAIKLAKVPK